ncbi:mitochondrial transcription rescue factor 1 isoform X2 [Palaemon carinicauda]|uniref:mitochondrial transcription rescue factor 1 isoform X2 n=1 Tax=Palaemon carinicauda TaxID=392227 RepID=UPI0035B58F5E
MAGHQFMSRYLRVWSCPRPRIVNSLVLCQYRRNVINSSNERIPTIQVTKQLWTVFRPFYSSELMIQNKLQMLSPIVISSRGRKSRKTKSGKDVLSDDDDDDDYDDWEVESGLDYKDFKIKVSSLRLDSILKSGLKMSRNKVENAFYSSRIRLNEQKVLKKSKQLSLVGIASVPQPTLLPVIHHK